MIKASDKFQSIIPFTDWLFNERGLYQNLEMISQLD